MSRCKKLIGAMISILMVFALTPVLAFAANGTNDDSGRIVIQNATGGESYSVYQVLTLESYNTEKEAYSYTAADNWADFLNGKDVKGKFINFSDGGYVTWVDGASIADFAKLAIDYAKEKGLQPTQGPVEATGDTVEFNDLNLGYYLLDSTMGTVCSLDTASPEVTVREKNSAPSIEKWIENGTDENGNTSLVEDNSAFIGTTLDFRTVITVGNGATNYTVHDKMSEGLTWTGVSDVVVTNNGILVDPSNYKFKGGVPLDGCTFELTFTEDFCKTLEAGSTLIVKYKAILNTEAVIGSKGNTNETWLSYGDNSSVTLEDTTTTYTSGFDIVKVDASNRVLQGAEFELYNAPEGGNLVGLTCDQETPRIYHVSTEDEINGNNYQSETIVAGVATINGLADGTYYLEEVVAPDGYNKLTERIAITVSRELDKATVNDVSVKEEGEDADSYAAYDPDLEYVEGGVAVINQTGLMLPSTGGIGTTIFYVIGSLLVVGAIIFIVSRKRRAGTEEK